MDTFESSLTKRISFILATKNRAEYLERSLPLIIDLKGPNDELIIVDGKSTDRTYKVINKYLDKIDVFVSEEDINAGYAQNKGVLLAKGKYIKIVTDDDVFFSEAMEQAVQVMEDNPEVDILLCGGKIEFPQENKYRILYLPPGTNYGKEAEDVFRYTGSGCGIFKRRRVFASVGLLDPNSYCSDGEFLARSINLGANVKFCIINMYIHTILLHSFTIAHEKKYYSDLFRACWKYCSRTFYFRYRFNIEMQRIFQRYPNLSWPVKTLHRLLRILLKRKNKYIEAVENKNPSKKQEEYIWDGSFS